MRQDHARTSTGCLHFEIKIGVKNKYSIKTRYVILTVIRITKKSGQFSTSSLFKGYLCGGFEKVTGVHKKLGMMRFDDSSCFVPVLSFVLNPDMSLDNKPIVTSGDKEIVDDDRGYDQCEERNRRQAGRQGESGTHHQRGLGFLDWGVVGSGRKSGNLLG